LAGGFIAFAQKIPAFKYGLFTNGMNGSDRETMKRTKIKI